MTTGLPSRIVEPPAPIYFDGNELRSAKYVANGLTTARAESLDVTWSRLEPLLDDAGITRVANVTGLDTVGIPVYTAIKPLGRTLASGSGKGTTADAARVGAAMEAWEQSVWEAQTLGHIIASEDELTEESRAFVRSASLPRRRNHLLTSRRRTHWTSGWDIVKHQSVLVPSLAVCVPHDMRGVWGGPLMSTNGLASGNSLLEAVCSGLLEVIERDASATHLPSSRPLNVESLTNDLMMELVARIERAGLTLELEDITSDTEVPVVTAVLHDHDNSSAGSFHGYGASLNSDVAVIRAITEAAQARTLIIAGSRDDIFGMERQAAVRIASLNRAPLPSVSTSLIEYQSRDESTPSFEGDMHALLAKIQHLGFDRVIVIRHTTDSDPLQVVRVIVPGMRNNTFRGTDGFPEGPLGRVPRSDRHNES